MFAARGIPVIDADEPAARGAGPRAARPRRDRRRLARGRRARRRASTASGWATSCSPIRRPQAAGGDHAPAHPDAVAGADRRAGRSGHRLALYEASLLVESGRDKELDGLIVVTASPATRLARVVARDGVREEDVRARMRAQLPQEDKVRLATHVIDNDGDLAATEAQVDRIIAELRS